MRRDLRFDPARIAEHVHFEEIGAAVAIHVGDVHTHRRVAHLAERTPIREPEGAAPVVPEEQVGVLEVVRDEELRRAIAVEVRETRAECERLRYVREHAARRVEKAATRERHRDERSLLVAIEVVGGGTLRHAQTAEVRAHHDFVVARVLGDDFVPTGPHLSHHLVEGATLRRDRIVDVVRLVVRDVEVEPAVAIGVGERDRRASLPGGIQAEIAALREAGRAIVQKDRVRARGRDEYEVQITVPVDVGERGAGREAVTGADARLLRDLLEPEPTDVLVERVASFRAREENVHQSVAIHIAECDTGALSEDPVPDERRVADRVLEGDPAAPPLHLGEPGGAVRCGKLTPPVVRLLVPRARRSRPVGATGGQHRHDER